MNRKQLFRTFGLALALLAGPSFSKDLGRSTASLAFSQEIAAIRAEPKHPQAEYWQIKPEVTVAMSKESSHEATADEIALYKAVPMADVSEILKRVVADRVNKVLLDPNEYIERHISPTVFKLLASDSSVDVLILPGDPSEAEAYLRAQGYTEISVVPRNSLTDFTLFLAESPSGGKKVLAIETLPGRSSVTEAIANVLFYRLNNDFAVSAARVKVTAPLHSEEERVAKILRDNEIDPDAIFFAYSSNLLQVIESMGGELVKVIDRPDFYARVLRVQNKIILSVPVEPYAYGDRAGQMLRGAHRAFPRSRLVTVVGTAGSLNGLAVNAYVIPKAMRSGTELVNFENLSAKTRLDANRDQIIESVDTILYETEPWLAAAKGSAEAAVEQEGFDLVKNAKALGYRVATVYRISDRVGVEAENFNHAEAEYKPDSLLWNWQRAFVDLMISP